MSETANVALGIDVGGTGIKGALVDLDTGSWSASGSGSTPRSRPGRPTWPTRSWPWPTTSSSTGPPGSRSRAWCWTGWCTPPPTCTRTGSASSLADLVGPRLRGPSTFLNDADAAGLAESHFGAARGTDGVVLLVTLGTGIGVAMISDGRLVANSELGHLELDGVDAETYAAASARKRNGHTWEEWGAHADHYLKHLEGLVWPKLFVLGGGITKNPEKWLQYLHPRTPIVLAQHINNAGISARPTPPGRAARPAQVRIRPGADDPSRPLGLTPLVSRWSAPSSDTKLRGWRAARKIWLALVIPTVLSVGECITSSARCSVRIRCAGRPDGRPR